MSGRSISEWGPRLFGGRKLMPDQWAPLRVQFSTERSDAVEGALDELTGFMDFLRYERGHEVLTGVGDGQLFIVQDFRHAPGVSTVTFYSSGVVGIADPDAFQRLQRARDAWVDQLRIEGLLPSEMNWEPLPYERHPGVDAGG